MFFGLDFIYDQKTHEWKLIEINVRPVGLAASTALSPTSINLDPAEYVSDAIKRRLRTGKRLVCLLPDRYSDQDLSILNDDHSTQMPVDGDRNMSLLLNDLRAFRARVETDVRCVRFAELLDEPALREPNIGFVLNYTTHRLAASIPAFNTYAACKLASDKFATFLFLRECGAVYTSTDATSLHKSGVSRDYVIAKPRYGSGSFGVSRHADSNGLSPDDYQVSDVSDYVFQPWIESDTIAGHSGFEYRYDVRVFVCEGEIVGAVIRSSAAPKNGVAAATPLAWLTTTGKLVTITALPTPLHASALIAASRVVTRRLLELS